MTSNSRNRRPRSKVRLPLWALVLLAVLLLIFVVGSSVLLFRTVRGLVSSYEATDPDFAIVDETLPVTAVTDTQQPPENNSGISLPALPRDSLKPWSGKERVTILMLGIDQRCDESGPTHTDSMMLVTIDPVGLSAGVMSLPRDMWVEIPGFDVDRINQAHYYGEAYEYPGGGPALAVETVEAFLGIEIDYYAAVNFDAFIEVVNQVDGIDLNVPEAIEDETYPDRCWRRDHRCRYRRAALNQPSFEPGQYHWPVLGYCWGSGPRQYVFGQTGRFLADSCGHSERATHRPPSSPATPARD